MAEDVTRPLGSPERTDPARELAAGSHVAEWTIVRRLGGGGFGAVYEVRHRTRGERGALKVLHAHFATSAEMLARFDREVSVLARLRHPNIVQVLDAGFDAAGRPYLCMELLVGRDLGTLLKADGRLALDDTKRMLEPLCDAVAAAHDAGIVHRDLKASNVFVCDDGRVVLLDFGIAKISDALAPELTASHQSLGTPGCMAPEQIHGSRVDARTDVYALGGLVFHMLTGRPAFHDPSQTMTQYLHLHARRPRPSALVPLPPTLDDVIVRAMAIEPADRYDDAPTLLAAIHAALRGSRVHAVVATAEYGAIYATVDDRTAGSELDAALLDDLERVLPALERFLSAKGFSLALDLGSSAAFVVPLRDVREVVRTALDAWEHLAERAGRDPRVRVGLCVHRGAATVVGGRLEPCELLRPETWGMPEPLDGVWVLEPSPRRLRQ